MSRSIRDSAVSISPSHNQNSNDKLDSLLNQIAEMQQKQNQIIASHKELYKEVCHIGEEVTILKKLLKRRDRGGETAPFNSKLPELPLSSKEDVMVAENILNNDEEEKRHLIRILGEVGGTKLASVIHNVMKTLLSKSAALKFSLKGKNQKENFENLKLHKCVLGEY